MPPSRRANLRANPKCPSWQANRTIEKRQTRPQPAVRRGNIRVAHMAGGIALALALAALLLRPAPDRPVPPPASQAPTAAPAPPGHCRWQGYGIGWAARGQCSTMHLLSHAVVECSAAGGKAADVRSVTGP